MNNLHIVSLNARGLKNKFKRKSLFDYLKKKRFDIICLQEAHVTKSDLEEWEKQWGGNRFINEGTNRSRGEVILVSKHFNGQADLLLSQDRLLVVSVWEDNLNLIIANVYAPNNTKEKIKFFHKLTEKLSEFNGKNVVLSGDFNCSLNSELDIISGQSHDESEIDALNETIDALNLTDAWRIHHPTDKEFTWSRSNPFIARRLDYCFLSQTTLNLCTSCDHLIIPSSDHKAVSLELGGDHFVRGPGYWRFNNSYLKNTSFIEKLNESLDVFLLENDELV